MIYKQKQINLHTHSFYCGHGSGTIEEYVKCAEEKGIYKVLGFSEHAPTPDCHFPKRMDYEMFPSYVEDVRKFQGNSNVEILIGAECDWLKEYRDFYLEEFNEKYNLDYLIGSVHYLTDHSDGEYKPIADVKDLKHLLIDYVDLYTQMLQSGMFLFGCHSDFYTCAYRDWNEDNKAAARDIIRCAKENNIPLEVNGYGFHKTMIEGSDGKLRYKYPFRPFWEMAAEEGVGICFNTDAHKIEHLHPDVAFDWIKETGLTLVDWSVEGRTVKAIRQ